MVNNSTDFDVIIIGGGPGGLSAALWCSDLGLRSVVIEKGAEFGGQLLLTFNQIENYLGVESTSGRELADRFLRHLENRAIDRFTGASIEDVDLDRKTVTLADGRILVGRAIIIATGVRRRKLEVQGEEEFAGQGVLHSGVKDRETVRGKGVVIVGGGDAALENALILGGLAKEITLVHRGSEFSAREEFVERAKELTNIRVVFNATVTAILGNTEVEALELQHAISGEITTISADAVLIRIGVVPNTEFLCGQVPLDGVGYVITDAYCATNVAGVYAVGDVANPVGPTVSNAVGQGATAAKSIAQWFLIPV